MIHKDKEIIVFESPKTVDDVMDHFKKIEKRQIHTLFITFACDMVLCDQIKQIFEDKLIKSQDSLKRLKIIFDATPLSQKDFIALNQFMGRMRQLRHLELSFGFCNIGLPSIISLVEGVVSFSELKGLTLDLTGNSVLSNQHKLLSDLWRIPSKYFKLILCQCNIQKFEYTLENQFDKTSSVLTKECASSIQQETQKQQNQYFQQHQQQPISERKRGRVSQFTPKKEEANLDEMDIQNNNLFGSIDQKSDNSISNPYLQFGDQEKQQILNIQKESNNETKKIVSTRSRKINNNQDNKDRNQSQLKMINSSYTGNIIPQGLEGDSTGISINSHTKPSENQEEVDADEQSEVQGEDKDKRSKQINQLHFLYYGTSEEEDKDQQNGKLNYVKNNKQQEDGSMIQEEQDQEYEDISNNDIEEDENDDICDEDDEDYQEKLNSSKKQKYIKKKESNIKTRSTRKNSETKKKSGAVGKAITKKNIQLQKNNLGRKYSLTKKNEDQQEVLQVMKKDKLQIHSKTAGKGEAYLKRTQSNKSNNGNQIKAINEEDNIIPEVDEKKGQILNTLVGMFQNSQNSDLNSNDYIPQTSQSQQKIQISQFQNSNEKQYQQMLDMQNEKGTFQSPIFQNQQYQQTSKKTQKRTIDKVVIDLRDNPQLQEQTLQIVASALLNTYSQINFFHLKAPPNKWNDLSTLEFGALIPNVLDIRIDPYGLLKIVFSNIVKSISTALRKLKFSQRLKDIPSTQHVHEEIQNWFCPEKDYLNKKQLMCGQCIDNQVMKNKEQYEEDNQRYQDLFFRSQFHQICPVCQNKINDSHCLQANTEELYFSYSQLHIDVKEYSQLLEKVAINLQTQFSQIFNDGQIKEHILSQNQQNLIASYINKNNQKQKDVSPLNSPLPSSNKRQAFSILSSPEQRSLYSTNYDTIYSCQTPVQISQIIQNTQNIQNKDNNQNYKQPILPYSSQYQDQQYFNSPQFESFQLPASCQLSSSISNNQNKLITESNNSQKLNNFQKKLERALKIKQIESIYMEFKFKDYYYETQYELVQKIFNIIKIISERIYIYKLYLCINKGISPLVLAQILFFEELSIDKIEAGCCIKDGNIFFINLSQPKFQIRRDDLQIFAKIINQNAFFDEIHINFDNSQAMCIQSISHLLTRYKQNINYKENILVIYRENTLPLFDFPQSALDYFEVIDEFGNFNDFEQELTTPIWQIESQKETQDKINQMTQNSNQNLNSNLKKSKKQKKSKKSDIKEDSQQKMELENIEQINLGEDDIIKNKILDKKLKTTKKRQQKKEKIQEEQENEITPVQKKKNSYKKKVKQQDNEQEEIPSKEAPKKKNSQKQKKDSQKKNKNKINQVEIIQNQLNNDNIFNNDNEHKESYSKEQFSKEQFSNDQFSVKQNSQIELNEQGNQNDDNINNSNTFEEQSYHKSTNLYQKQNQNPQELLY